MTNRFELLAQSVTDYAIYMLDLQGVINSWNVGAEQLKGIPPKKRWANTARGSTPKRICSAGFPSKACGRRGKSDDSTEGWRARKDGARFWASVVIDPVRDDEGALIGFAKITRDPERRESQLALE